MKEQVDLSSVVIFGDSFSDPNYLFNDHPNWHSGIKTNISFQGIGAIGLLKHFFEYIKLNDTSEKDLVFILPDCNRLDLEYLPNKSLAANAKLVHQYYHNDSNISSLNFVYSNKDKIFEDYESFYRSGIHNVLPIMVLNSIITSQLLFKSVMIWPCNNMYFEHIDNQSVDINFKYIKKILNKTDIFLVNKSLLDISLLSNFDTNCVFYDTRNNHLSASQHQLVRNVVLKWILQSEKTIL